MPLSRFNPENEDSPVSRERSLLAAAQAPGRVNLMGEHTDYNGGFVLPLALPLKTRCVAVKRPDDWVHAVSFEIDQGLTQIGYQLGKETPRRSWIDYVQGVTRVLHERGFLPKGFDLCISSDIPLGSGLSSSAALEVSILRALRQLFGFSLDDLSLALAAHRAETDFVGAKVGVMDQMAASLGDARHALFLNTQTLRYERIPLPNDALLIILDSGIAHHHASGGYNRRREECVQAARLLNVNSLSALGHKDLERISLLPDPLNRRVRHVVTENQRVLDTIQAFKDNDLRRAGTLFYDSHASMRADYEVSIPEIDFMVEALKLEGEGIFGARLTGGGFGGCIVVLAHPDFGLQAAHKATAAYNARFSQKARVLLALNPAAANCA